MSKQNVNLGDRRDFWNTRFNPITGFLVPNQLNSSSQNDDKNEYRAEYGFNFKG